MGKIIGVLAVLSVLAFVPSLQADEGKSYGSGVTVAETTSMAKILADPDAWVGKKVRIEGKVVDVCPMAGCWMEMEEGEGGTKMRVKVADGVIVFPVDAKGKLAVAEGVVESIPMTREKYVDWLQHIADETGKAFDASKVGEGPFRVLQIQGTGARIPG